MCVGDGVCLVVVVCVCVLVSGGGVSVLCVWIGGGVTVGGRC